MDGRDFMAVIRLYGSDLSFFDQTWKPDDVVKINESRKEKSHEENSTYKRRYLD